MEGHEFVSNLMAALFLGGKHICLERQQHHADFALVYSALLADGHEAAEHFRPDAVSGLYDGLDDAIDRFVGEVWWAHRSQAMLIIETYLKPAEAEVLLALLSDNERQQFERYAQLYGSQESMRQAG